MAAFPTSISPLDTMLAALVSEFSGQIRSCIALSGSLARGEGDRYSDLDLWLIVANQTQLARARKIAANLLNKIGDPITSFWATHLGTDDLLVTFLERDAGIVKVDIEFALANEFHRPSEMVPIEDPANLFPSLPIREPKVFDVEEAGRRAAGWLWYAYCKIVRGELFEAADALDTIRKLAFVPIQLHAAGAIDEGYRRLERKLEKLGLDILRKTYPSQVSKPALLQAMSNLGKALVDVLEGLDTSSARSGVQRVGRILEFIQRDMRAAHDDG